MTTLNKLFGARIYELRIRNGLTQWQLAEKADISNDMISRIERGQRSPSFEVLERLAAALGVEVRELFNFSNKKFTQGKCALELIDLLHFLEDKKPKEIEMILRLARLILEQTK